LRIIFAGTPANAAQSLRTLVSSGHDVVAALTREDAPVGRKRVVTESAVASVSRELGIETIKANTIGADVRSLLSKYRADIGVVVAYGVLFDAKTLNLFDFGWVNLHYSLLPAWRGAAPVQAALLSGANRTGVSLFQLDEGMDTGPIWNSVQAEIHPRENAKDLLARLSLLGDSLLLETLPQIFGKVIQPIQQSGLASYAKKLSRDQVKLDFSNSAISLERVVRAANPEPIAWCMCNGNQIQVLEAFALGNTNWNELGSTSAPIGTLFKEKNRVMVQAGMGTLLEIAQVRPSGKSQMSADDWYRGIDPESFLT